MKEGRIFFMVIDPQKVLSSETTLVVPPMTFDLTDADAVADNNDAVEAEISGTIDIEPKDCDLALAQIAKMRICVESLLAKLPDKYLETFQEAPKASLQNPEPVTYVRLI